MNKPMISVVMISYNHEDFIEESLMSVIEQRSDKYDLEILIVDDGSTDDTQKIITAVQGKYPDILFPTFKKHIGITAINKNLNEQIKKTRGEYIAFLAGDDYFIGNGLSKQLKAFKTNKTIDVVIAEGRNFSIEKNIYLETCQEDIIVKMLNQEKISDIYDYIISHVPKLFIQAFMIKKYLLEAVNYFDEELIADDWVLNIRIFKYLAENNKLAVYIEDEVFQHNFHILNTTNNKMQQCPRIIQVFKKYTPKELRPELLSEYYITCGVYFLKNGQLIQFLKYFFYSIPLVNVVIPKVIKKYLRRS